MATTLRSSVHPLSLRPQVWEQISAALKQERHILNTRTAPDDLHAAYEAGLAVVLVDDQDEVVGFIAAWVVSDDAVEIGSAWVKKTHRGCGVGKRLFFEVSRLRNIAGKKVFLITQNPVALSAATAAGFVRHFGWHTPVPWELTCGACDVLSDQDKPSCPYRNGVCALCLLP